MTSGKFVLPGDLLATSEEFIPGEGTYEEGGGIYSSNVGFLELDRNEMIARVRANKISGLPKEGDIILGKVRDVSGKLAMVEMSFVEGIARGLATSSYGTLHISRMAERHVENPRKEFKAYDIVRAEVALTKPSIQLSTRNDDLGVVKAYCGRCRGALTRKGDQLYCEECDRTEHRKISGYYGQPLMPSPPNEILKCV